MSAHARAGFLSERRAAKHCGTLWQHRFWEHLIRDDRDFRHHLDYLHGNPLKHGLVERVADWPWSTFHRWVRQGVYPADWAGARSDGLVVRERATDRQALETILHGVVWNAQDACFRVDIESSWRSGSICFDPQTRRMSDFVPEHS